MDEAVRVTRPDASLVVSVVFRIIVPSSPCEAMTTRVTVDPSPRVSATVVFWVKATCRPSAEKFFLKLSREVPEASVTRSVILAVLTAEPEYHSVTILPSTVPSGDV